MVKKSNLQVLNDKNLLASILNLGAILKFDAWQHFIYFFPAQIFKKENVYRSSIKSKANRIDFCYISHYTNSQAIKFYFLQVSNNY
jgi:hypothetical protein